MIVSRIKTQTYSYIKTHNTNQGNPSSYISTTVKQEYAVSIKKEVNLGVGKASLKSTLTNNGKVRLESKAEAKINKFITLAGSTSYSTSDEKKGKVEAGTSISSATGKFFGQVTGGVKSTSYEVGVSMDFTNNSKNTKSGHSISIKYK